MNPSETKKEDTIKSENSLDADNPLNAVEPIMHESAVGNDANLEVQVVNILRTVFDPEIPVNIYDLGLIYKIKIDEEKKVAIDMTLTSPACPVAGTLPGEVAEKIKTHPFVEDCKVDLVFEPAWDQSKMSEDARLELNLF